MPNLKRQRGSKFKKWMDEWMYFIDTNLRTGVFY